MAEMNLLLLMVVTVGSWGVGHARCPSLTQFSASNRCARFYEHSSCRGRFLQVNKGEEAGTLPPGWDNRASSVVVARGCRLRVYINSNFGVCIFSLIIQFITITESKLICYKHNTNNNVLTRNNSLIIL